MKYLLYLIVPLFLIAINSYAINQCDINSINYQLNQFEDSYKSTLYGSGYDELSQFYNHCKSQIDPKTALRINYALARAKFQPENTQECNDPFKYDKVSCMPDDLNLEKPRGNKDYSWLLNNHLSLEDKQMLYTILIANDVPKRIPHFLFPANLRSVILERTIIPNISKDFDGLSTGCAPHDCNKQGLLWVDIQKGASLIGVLEGHYLVLTSKFYSINAVPRKAKQEIKKLALDFFSKQLQDLEQARVLYFDISSKKASVFSLAWLDGDSSLQFADPSIPNYDEPVKVIKLPPPKPSEDDGPDDPPYPITCRIYPKFAIVTHGPYEIIKKRDKRSETFSLCNMKSDGTDETDNGREITEGVVDNVIFYPYDEKFGLVSALILNSNLLEPDEYSRDTVIRYKQGTLSFQRTDSTSTTKKTSASYNLPLKIKCNPSKNNPQCWAEILAKNAKESFVNSSNIKAPNCDTVYKQYPNLEKEHPDGSRLLITARVSIPDIKHAQITYLGGETTCEILP